MESLLFDRTTASQLKILTFIYIVSKQLYNDNRKIVHVGCCSAEFSSVVKMLNFSVHFIYKTVLRKMMLSSSSVQFSFDIFSTVHCAVNNIVKYTCPQLSKPEATEARNPNSIR